MIKIIWKTYISRNIAIKVICKLPNIPLNYRKFLASNNTHSMLKSETLLKPDPTVSGMIVLDKAKFDKTITIQCVDVTQAKLTDVLPYLKKYMLKIPKLKPIQTVDTQTLVMLNPETVSKWNDIDVNDRMKLSEFHIEEEDFILRSQKLTYDNYMAEDILKAILPKHKEGMSSFTKVGHIVHVNLREHLLPYKNIIGQVLYDKVPLCETVVNKINIIENTYRNFKMEVLCGKDDLKTTLKQNNSQFEFDFGKVYWNSRLSTEHERIVKLLNKDDVLFDIFAGVGPFSIPAAKKKCVVYANDLNPESFKWLKHNVKLNKIDEKYVHIFNKDGKDFILDDMKANLLKYMDKNVHIVMNLPALAVDFLKYFVGLYDANQIPNIKIPPNVYVYCFAKGEDYMKITEKLLSSSLDRDMSNRIEMFRVRTVSSFKEMMRVKFKLTEDILIAQSTCKRPNEDCKDVPTKRCTAMGKSKNHKVKNIFKVAGAKSLKSKTKAKIVKGQLKRITIKNKAKTSEVNQQLVNIENEIRQTEKKPEPTNDTKKPPPPAVTSATEKDYESLKNKSDAALENLNDMQL